MGCRNGAGVGIGPGWDFEITFGGYLSPGAGKLSGELSMVCWPPRGRMYLSMMCRMILNSAPAPPGGSALGRHGFGAFTSARWNLHMFALAAPIRLVAGMTRVGLFQLGAMAGVLVAPAALLAQEGETAAGIEAARQVIVEKGLDFLQKEGQAEDGTFSIKAGPGVTALALTAALRNGQSIDSLMVSKGLKALESFVKPDGGIYGSGRLRNYETCIAMVCFAEANQNGQYDEILKRAKEFITGLQYSGANRPESDPWYGGVGYAGSERPDLSNTGYFIEALRAVETPSSDPAIQNALKFISRCQNFESEFNDTPFGAMIDDGGFYYEIPIEKIDPSTSPERFTPEGGLRSYGSMTYTGLKSMIYAGLTATDPRVKAAVKWIQNHYDVSNNPGMGQAGLFYYYHTFSIALKTAGIDEVEVENGSEQAWRADLIKELAKRQNTDGSWSNANERWFEGDKNLATSFALLSLAYCKPQPTTGNGN